MTPTLYQLELDQTSVNCGMSYVIQLADGSFFIIDGGYFTAGEDERLLEFLKAHSSGTPTIAAWYFSHAHQDHVGNFIQFIRNYRDEVSIQKLLYNFHPVDLSEVSGDWKSNDPATIKAFYETVDEYCHDIETVTIRTGESYAFGELTVDILYTNEDLYPTKAGFNDYSTVIRATVGGQRIIWFADVAVKASTILLERPDELRCDIMQVSHHGIDNHDILHDLYAATQADVALWPTPDYGMVERKDQEVNSYLLNDLDMKEHLVSGYGTVALPLPYTPGMATKSEKAYSFERQPEAPPEFTEAAISDSPFQYMTPRHIIPNAVKTV